eukprot:jgi/Phyca11/535640/estExt2_fgenesh1_pg.C_PHYCAscaffold_390057
MTSPFGPLHLSSTDTLWLQELVRLLVREHILSYEKRVWLKTKTVPVTQRHRSDSMRLKSSYVGDKFANCAVLATLERPTANNPFRSHTLKWFESEQPLIFRPIVKNRDFVFTEATGVVELADGERVGYHVLHSVTFPGAKAMNGNIRAHMAVCAFYRQLSDGVVEVFTKTTANPGGHVSPSISIKYGANALLSAQKLRDCAHAKKLSWAIYEQLKLHARNSR